MLKTIIIVACLATGVLVLADKALYLDKINDLQDKHTDTLNKTNNSTGIESRKLSPLHYFLPFQALWSFGGALGILFAIKFKIIVVALIVAASVFYYTKFVAAKRNDDGPLVKEGAIYPAMPDHSFSHGGPMIPVGGVAEGYSNHIPDISSYGSLDPYSAYHGFHHDMSPAIHFDHSGHHDFHHSSPHFDHHDFHHSSPHFDHHDIHYDHHGIHSSPHFDHSDHHDIHSSPHFDHSDHHDIHPDISSPPGLPDQSIQSVPDNHNIQGIPSDAALLASISTRRVSKGRSKRSNGSNYIDINMPTLGELAFQFLGVNTEGCRRRFVCEFNFRARNNLIMELAYGFVSRSIFEKYRDLSNGDEIPTKFPDCARIFNDCKAAEKYNAIDQDYKEHGDEESDDSEYIEGSGNPLEEEYPEEGDEQKSENPGYLASSDDNLESGQDNQVSSVDDGKGWQPSESVQVKQYILSRHRRF